MIRMNTLLAVRLMRLVMTALPVSPVMLRVRMLCGRVDETEREEQKHQRHEPPEDNADQRLVRAARRRCHWHAGHLRVLRHAAIAIPIRLDLSAQEALALLAHHRQSERQK